MKVEYRQATLSDVALLGRMHQQSVEEECSEPCPTLSECEAEIERCITGKAEAIVFQMDGAGVGYCLFQREPEGIFLRHFFVSRECRRNGIGRSAMQWLVAEAWRRPARIRLAVQVENAAGIAFWRSVGFTDWLIDMKLEARGPAQHPPRGTMTAHTDELCRHRWMALCRGLNGEPFIRETGGGVFVVPVTDRDEVLFVIEPAVTDGTSVLWLPAGAIETSEDPVVAANRELQEEIGYKAARLDVLSELRPLARHGDWRVHAVLARELVHSKLMGDEDHQIKVESVPLSQFERLIDAGRLLDSTCIAAVFLARRFMADEPSVRKQIGQHLLPRDRAKPPVT